MRLFHYTVIPIENLALQSAQNYRKLRQTDITVRKTMEQHLGLKTLILQ